MKKRQGVIERINYADVIIVFILIIFTLLALYPFVYTIAGSFNDGIDYEYAGIWLFPRKFTLANYITVFTDARLYKAFFNTVIAPWRALPEAWFSPVAWLTPCLTRNLNFIKFSG